MMTAPAYNDALAYEYYTYMQDAYQKSLQFHNQLDSSSNSNSADGTLFDSQAAAVAAAAHTHAVAAAAAFAAASLTPGSNGMAINANTPALYSHQVQMSGGPSGYYPHTAGVYYATDPNAIPNAAAAAAAAPLLFTAQHQQQHTQTQNQNQNQTQPQHTPLAVAAGQLSFNPPFPPMFPSPSAAAATTAAFNAVLASSPTAINQNVMNPFTWQQSSGAVGQVGMGVGSLISPISTSVSSRFPVSLPASATVSLSTNKGFGSTGHGAGQPTQPGPRDHRRDRHSHSHSQSHTHSHSYPHSNIATEVDNTDKDPLTYKTEVCRTHLTTGHCDYGPTCQFAHGVMELRSREFDSKYKTELCKNFHLFGTSACFFASRCKFIHDEYRVRAGEYEFWLVSPSENLLRVELVDPRNTSRLEQLTALVNNPPKPPVSPLKPTERTIFQSQMEEEKEKYDSMPLLPIDQLKLSDNNSSNQTNASRFELQHQEQHLVASSQVNTDVSVSGELRNDSHVRKQIHIETNLSRSSFADGDNSPCSASSAASSTSVASLTSTSVSASTSDVAITSGKKSQLISRSRSQSASQPNNPSPQSQSASHLPSDSETVSPSKSSMQAQPMTIDERLTLKLSNYDNMPKTMPMMKRSIDHDNVQQTAHHALTSKHRTSSYQLLESQRAILEVNQNTIAQSNQSAASQSALQSQLESVPLDSDIKEGYHQIVEKEHQHHLQKVDKAEASAASTSPLSQPSQGSTLSSGVHSHQTTYSPRTCLVYRNSIQAPFDISTLDSQQQQQQQKQQQQQQQQQVTPIRTTVMNEFKALNQHASMGLLDSSMPSSLQMQQHVQVQPMVCPPPVLTNGRQHLFWEKQSQLHHLPVFDKEQLDLQEGRHNQESESRE